jgi:hypothetical protein
VEIIPVPSDARNYSNVKLHVSMGHAVGKTTLREKGKDEAPKLLAAIKGVAGADRKVPVVCHLAVEPHFAAYKDTFKTLDVGH